MEQTDQNDDEGSDNTTISLKKKPQCQVSGTAACSQQLAPLATERQHLPHRTRTCSQQTSSRSFSTALPAADRQHETSLPASLATTCSCCCTSCYRAVYNGPSPPSHAMPVQVEHCTAILASEKAYCIKRRLCNEHMRVRYSHPAR